MGLHQSAKGRWEGRFFKNFGIRDRGRQGGISRYRDRPLLSVGFKIGVFEEPSPFREEKWAEVVVVQFPGYDRQRYKKTEKGENKRAYAKIKKGGRKREKGGMRTYSVQH